MLNTSMIYEPNFLWTDFSITTYCQAKCRSCSRTNPDTGEPQDWLEISHMSYEMFDKIISKAPDELLAVQFCGELGDPMMHPEITKFVDRALAQESVVKILINTNGGLRQPEWYKDMGEKYGKRLAIAFGIDGTSHESNWKYREGVDWQRAMDNMIAISTTKSQLEWHFLIFEWNWQEVTEAAAIAKQHGIKINFKFNNRTFGRISSENKATCEKMLENINET